MKIIINTSLSVTLSSLTVEKKQKYVQREREGLITLIPKEEFP
jgi:hypothetical protein